MPGSLVEFAVNGRSFKCAADADGNTMLGGKSNEFSANGDGISGRLIQTVTGWKFSGINFAIDDDNDDQEFLQNIADAGRFVPMKAVYSDGTVRAGQGNITGDIEVSSMNGTAPLTLEGPGKFIKQ
ncbi:hypothetical protein NVP1164O_13 [Vibrio phage 1.164.O._10N.261.51.A7]|nr:hypothetical protein NVP1164O_13 [Vibrio phage 1.164.O._10N.261.51.A7]AUR96466.1 hypothetical protein NVP1225O_14 [Vibrio phage 1.225.O._10N.261.48.B7]